MDKFFLKSKTVIGLIISVLPALLPALGLSFSADDGQLVSGSFDSIMQGVGGVVALYGRFAAGGISVLPKSDA